MPVIEAEYFSELYRLEFLIVYAAICVLNGVLLLFSSNKFLLAFQQCRYNEKEYLKWFSSKQNSYIPRLFLLCLMAFLFFCVLCTTFAGVAGDIVSSYVGFASYILFVSIYINTERHVNAKIHLKKTRRMVRLCITYFILIMALTFGIITLSNALAFWFKSKAFALVMYSLTCVTPLIAPIVLTLASVINKPFESWNNKRYIAASKEVLNKSGVLKIGVTGSYGKTTVKNMLSTILGCKYRVLATPESYNTPLGVSLAVKKLDATHDIFIAEMGARHKGDIEDLAAIVKPDYAVLTGVNSQHLETFGSEEVILATKFELFKSLGEGGKGFFSSDNEGAKLLYDNFDGEKYLAGIDGDLVKAENIVITETGMNFILKIKGEKPVNCNTTLLGKHNISNICLSAGVAYKIGLTPREIADGINRLKAVNHRLELVTNQRGIKIIDDSYNSNEDGVKAATEVLKSFEGRKIVVTPGLIELGKRENLANYEMGKSMAAVCDKLIIIGRHNAEMLIKGWCDGGKTSEDVIFAKSLAKGNEKLNEIMKEGDVVLFENDLPDTYN